MFDYLYADDVKSMQMITIPKLLFSSPEYILLSAKSKVLYALLLESRDECTDTVRPYADYKIHEICDDLCCSSSEAAAMLSELHAFGLIQCEGGRVYVNDFEKAGV
jgi:hypothetical protein